METSFEVIMAGQSHRRHVWFFAKCNNHRTVQILRKI